MNNKDKKALLARYIELKVKLGEDIRDYITRPLSYYDFDLLTKVVALKEKEYEQM